MISSERVSLLDAKLELTQHATVEERAELDGVSLPVVSVDAGRLNLHDLLWRHSAFGATLLDGLVMSSMQVGGHTGVQLLGPGDLLVTGSELGPTWIGHPELRLAAPAELGLLGNDLLVAAHRWPGLIQGLYESMGYQQQRLTAQLVICQLPRVEDRVLAMLWLLAETWGHVTPGGIRLPLALTHETLGALVGARRPTVTLALGKLTDDGALVAQDSGWLLHDAPHELVTVEPGVVPTQLVATAPGRWAAAAPTTTSTSTTDRSHAYAELRATIRQLREEHRANRQSNREQLARVRSDRVRMVALRDRIAANAFSRQPPPSS